MKNIKKIDRIILSLLAVFAIIAIFQHFIDGYVLTVNNYAAVILLIVISFFQFLRNGRFASGIALLLGLNTFGIVNFFTFSINGQIRPLEIKVGSFYFEASDMYYSTIGFNLLFFIGLLVYCYINIDYVKSILGRSEEEADKMVIFYYKKFLELPLDEYQDVKKEFDKYPEEAQVAIKRIESEKHNIESSSN